MKLVRKTGSIKCHSKGRQSYWTFANNFMTIITNDIGDALLPPIGDMKALVGSDKHNCRKKHFYKLSGTDGKSPELVFPHFSHSLSLSKGEKLQIWHGQDWVNCLEDDNRGKTCVDIYAWYI